MMTGRASWILLLLVAHIFSSANPSQAAPIEDTNPQEGAIEEDADTSSSSSKDVELTAEMPPVGDSALLNELTPARLPLIHTCFHHLIYLVNFLLTSLEPLEVP
nr:hypothetical transcript [Hymenolepis microstoma]